MNYKQCEDLYTEFEMGNEIKILINNEWIRISDIEEDAHRGWICVTESGKTLELSKINPKDIKVNYDKNTSS